MCWIGVCRKCWLFIRNQARTTTTCMHNLSNVEVRCDDVWEPQALQHYATVQAILNGQIDTESAQLLDLVWFIRKNTVHIFHSEHLPKQNETSVLVLVNVDWGVHFTARSYSRLLSPRSVLGITFFISFSHSHTAYIFQYTYRCVYTMHSLMRIHAISVSTQTTVDVCELSLFL